MPTYKFSTKDGQEFDVESEADLTDAEIAAAVQQLGAGGGDAEGDLDVPGWFGDKVARFRRGGATAVGNTLQGVSRLGYEVGRMFGADAGVPPEERRARLESLSPLWRLGRDIAEGADEAFPVDHSRDRDLSSILADSAGQLIPTVVTGGAGRVAAALQYGLSAGEQGAQEAEAAGRPDVARSAFLGNAVAGAASEGLLGLGPRFLPGLKAAGKPGAVRRVAGSAVREGAQEGVEQVGQNLVASTVAGYDPDRPAGEGVGTAIAAGAILGGGVTAGVDVGARAVERVVGWMETADGPAVETAPEGQDRTPGRLVFRRDDGAEFQVDRGEATPAQVRELMFRTQPGVRYVGTVGEGGQILPDPEQRTEMVGGVLRQVFGGQVPDRIQMEPGSPLSAAGRRVRGKIGEDGRVTLYPENIQDEAEALEVLRHELLHDVWGDPEVEAEWQRFRASVDLGAARAEAAGLGYAEAQAAEEAAVNEVLKRGGGEVGMLKKWVDAVLRAAARRGWGAASRILGSGRLADADARALVRYATRLDRVLRGADAAAGGDRFSVGPDGPAPEPFSPEWLATAVGNPEENYRLFTVRREGIGVGKNRELEFQDAKGRPIVLGALAKHGGKTFEQWMRENDAWLSPEEIAAARKWYTELHDYFVKLYGRDARKMMIAWLAAQQNVSPAGALPNVYKVMDRLAGWDAGQKGGLADGKLNSILQGLAPEKGFGPKLMDFVDAGFGKKTRTFMGDRPEAGQPFVADVHTGRDSGHVDQQTLSRLVEKAESGDLFRNGKPIRAKILQSKVDIDDNGKEKVMPEVVEFRWKGGGRVVKRDLTGSPSGNEYQGISVWGNKLAEHLNRVGYHGGNWTPSEAQAVGWMRILRQYGLPESTVQEAIQSNTHRISTEVDFGMGSKLPENYPALSSLPEDARVKITEEVLARATNELVELIGGSLQVLEMRVGSGMWQGSVAPSLTAFVLGSDMAAANLTDALALVAEQAGTMRVTFGKGGQSHRAVIIKGIDGRGELTQEELADLVEFANATWKRKNDSLVKGWSAHPLPGQKGHVFAALTGARAKRIFDAALKWGEARGVRVLVDNVPAESESHEQDWKSDPDGGGYRANLNRRGGSQGVRRIVDYRRRYAALLEEAFARHAPGAVDPAGAAHRAEAVSLKQDLPDPATGDRLSVEPDPRRPAQAHEPAGALLGGDPPGQDEAARIEQVLASTEPQDGKAWGPADIPDLVVAGAAVRRVAADSRSAWSSEMVRRFGPGVGRYLGPVWDRVQRIETGVRYSLGPEALGQRNQIEDLAGDGTRVPPEARPLYPEEVLARGRPNAVRAVSPESVQIRMLGGARLLEAKRRRDIIEATEVASVRRQADALRDRVQASARAAVGGWGLPAWMVATARARRFMARALHIAARLNPTGRNPDGSWAWADFNQRMGWMTPREFRLGGHTVGGTVEWTHPVLGTRERVQIGGLGQDADGRPGYQLTREISAEVQRQLWGHYSREYPEMMWFLEMFIDPSLRDTRVSHYGVEIPVFNRVAQAAMMAEGDPNFSPLQAYTPDVLVTRSLLGAIKGALLAAPRSPGRKYKTGRARESGNVRDLLSGWNVRTVQMLRERSRREWVRAVAAAAVPIQQGQVPEGWTRLETAFSSVWEAVQRMRRWRSPVDPATGDPIMPETEARLSDDGSDAWRAFFGEAARLRGRQLMLPTRLVEMMRNRYVAQETHGALYRLGAWLIRNSTRLFLAAPTTYVANVGTNDLFALEAATRRILSGLMKADGRDLRFARELLVGEVSRRFIGLRQALGWEGGDFMRAVRETLPDQVFAEGTGLRDLDISMDESPLESLGNGEIGSAALQLIRYGNVDLRAKQRMAYAWLRAEAVTNAKRAGLRGQDLRRAVERYMENPPVDDRARAVAVSNFELLNYADSPAWLERFARNPYGKLILPFPRFGYHFVQKNVRRAAALRTALSRVPAPARADALADFLTFLLWPAGGLGALGGALVRGLGDEDDARMLVGTSMVKTLNAAGEVDAQPMDRTIVTANRINLSAWARAAGLGDPNREEDFWMRVRNYPVIAMGGAVILAEHDARKFGAKEGVRTYLQSASDLASDFFSLGIAAKVPDKVLQTLKDNTGGRRPPAMVTDPYGTRVPMVAYVTDQALDSLLPGGRQADMIIRWLDPVARRKTRSDRIGFTPGAWDAARAGHWTGLLDRLLAGEGGRSTLPPEGPVDRWGRISEQEVPLSQRVAEVMGANIRPIRRDEYRRALLQ